MRKLAFSIAKSRTKFLFLLFVIEIIILSCISPYFFNMNNLLQVTQFGATLTLLSLGEALVMISGRDGIDISVGSAMSLSGVIFGLAVMNGCNILTASIITLLGGVVLGAVNGLLIAVAKVPALIATLGTQYIYSSLALYLTGGIPISGFPDSFSFLSLENTFGIPNQILFVVIPVSVLVFILVYKMKFGRRVYLMGTNPEAAKFTGIRERKVRAMVYVLAGVLASISAIINNSWLMTARADAGTGMEMQAITVAVLGGIGVAGGIGHLGGVLIGVVIITMLNSGLQIANVNSVWQLAALGFILIIAIILNQLMSRFVLSVEKTKKE
nr:ABC transporter permease [uncultured Sellimonas sp.]